MSFPLVHTQEGDDYMILIAQLRLIFRQTKQVCEENLIASEGATKGYDGEGPSAGNPVFRFPSIRRFPFFIKDFD
jgi:hypothetical protein